jgi:DNA-binding transcriptional ArsR family regulator
MGDPVRQRILEMLSRGRQPAGTIARTLDMKPPAVPHHLRKLREAGLIVGIRNGNEILYRLNVTVIKEVSIYLGELAHSLQRTEGKRRQ